MPYFNHDCDYRHACFGCSTIDRAFKMNVAFYTGRCLDDKRLDCYNNPELYRVDDILQHQRYMAHLLGVYCHTWVASFRRKEDRHRCFHFTLCIDSEGSFLNYERCVTSSYPPIWLMTSYCDTEENFSFERLEKLHLNLFGDFHAACEYVRQGCDSEFMGDYEVSEHDHSGGEKFHEFFKYEGRYQIEFDTGALM